MTTSPGQPLWHTLTTAVGILAWFLALLAAMYLTWLGLSDRNPNFGGRSMEAVIGGAPYLVTLLVATIAALATAGFDWVLPTLSHRGVRWLLVLAAVMATGLMAIFAIGTQMDKSPDMPWVLGSLRRVWFPLVWLPVVATAPANLPGLVEQWAPRVWQQPLLVAGTLLLVVSVVGSAEFALKQRAATARQRSSVPANYVSFEDSQLAWLRESDPTTIAVTLLSYAGTHRKPHERELALSRLALVPDLQGVLEGTLRGKESDVAFAYLDGQDPPRPAELAPVVEEGIRLRAATLRDARMRADARPEPAWLRLLLRLGIVPDDLHVRDVQQIVGTVNRLSGLGVTHDFSAAMRELHAALAPRSANHPPPMAQKAVAQWLREHGG